MLSDGREHHLNSVTCVKWTEFKWKLRNYGSAAWTLTAAHYRVQQEWRVFRPVRLESGWVDVDQVGQFSSNLIRLVYQFACSLQMLLITTGRLRIGLLLYINVCADPSLCAVYNMDVCSLPDYFISFYKTSKPVSCSAAPGSKNFSCLDLMRLSLSRFAWLQSKSGSSRHKPNSFGTTSKEGISWSTLAYRESFEKHIKYQRYQ